MRTFYVSSVLTLSLAIAACGGGEGAKVSDKKSAAGAAYEVQRTGEDVGNRSGSGLRASQNLGGSQTITVSGQSGQAVVTHNTNLGTGGITAEYTIAYEDYSPDGETTYNGTITHRVEITGNAGSGSIRTALSGEVTLTGAIESSLKMELSVDITGGGGSGSIQLQGFVEADGTRYDFAGDVLRVDEIDDFQEIG